MKKAKTITYLMIFLIAMSFTTTSLATSSPFSFILSKYYPIKEALVKGDATSAANAASDFARTIKAIDINTLTGKERDAFKSVKAKLETDATVITSSRDITKQRAAFQHVSQGMITLGRSSALDAAAYISYCPMKTAYWISAQQEIRNPYYGSSMLTCGKVTETLQPNQQ